MQTPRVTLDTNVLISGVLFPTGSPQVILRAWKRSAFVLVTSSQLIEEFSDVLHRPNIRKKYHISESEIEKILWLLCLKSFLVEPEPIQSIPVRDAKDVMVLATALSGAANYLVTGDKDLLVLQDNSEISGLIIVTVKMFLSVLDLP